MHESFPHSEETANPEVEAAFTELKSVAKKLDGMTVPDLKLLRDRIQTLDLNAISNLRGFGKVLAALEDY